MPLLFDLQDLVYPYSSFSFFVLLASIRGTIPFPAPRLFPRKSELFLRRLLLSLRGANRRTLAESGDFESSTVSSSAKERQCPRRLFVGRVFPLLLIVQSDHRFEIKPFSEALKRPQDAAEAEQAGEPVAAVAVVAVAAAAAVAACFDAVSRLSEEGATVPRSAPATI